MSHDRKFSHESLQDKETIKQYLQAVQEGLDKGRIVLSSLEDEIELQPRGLLKLTLKARRKGESSRLQIKIQWEDKATRGESEDVQMRIGSEGSS